MSLLNTISLPATDLLRGPLLSDSDLLELANDVDASQEVAKASPDPCARIAYQSGARAIMEADAIRRLHGLPDSRTLRSAKKETP